MARMSWGGRGAKQRSWRKWNKNNHDKHAPGASIDMKPLSWRKSWPLSISKSGSAGRASRRLGTIGPPMVVDDLCAPARRSNWWARPPAARSGCARRRAGPGLADIAFAVGAGGYYALIRADGTAPVAHSHARARKPAARAAVGLAGLRQGRPLQSRAGCDVPSQGGGRGTTSWPTNIWTSCAATSTLCRPAPSTGRQAR